MKINPDGEGDSTAAKAIGAILTRLAGEKTLRHTELVELSNVAPADMPMFKTEWLKVPVARRREVATRLVEMAEDNAELTFYPLFRVLLKDDDAEVRESAIEGLWEDDATALIATFTKMMEQDASEDVQAAAAAALGKFALLAECGKLRDVYNQTLSKALLDVVNTPSKPLVVRRRALESVSAFSQPGVEEAIKAAYVSGDHDYKMSALFAMGRHCDTAFLPILTVELSSDDSETRYEAASALGEMGEEAAVSHLVELLDDADADVQMTAIRSLGEIGGAQAKKVLQRCLTSTNEAIVEMAQDALDELNTGEDPLDFKF
jgi:HEAT repeat protein